MPNLSGLLRIAVAAVICIAPASAFAHPGSAIVVDRQGQIFFLDTGGGVWKISVKGELTKLGGPRFHWMAIDNSGLFLRTQLPTGTGGDLERVAENPALIVSSDYPIAIGANGSFYYPDRRARPIRILQLSSAGRTTPLASVSASSGNPAPREINGIAAGPDGSIYYTENRAVRRISPDGRVTTVIANVTLPGCLPPPGEPPNEPYLRGLAVDSAGSVYAAASGCSSLLRIAGGRASVILQLQSPWSPTAVALHHGDIYVQEYLHTVEEDRARWIPRVRKILPDGRSTIIATVRR